MPIRLKKPRWVEYEAGFWRERRGMHGLRQKTRQNHLRGGAVEYHDRPRHFILHGESACQLEGREPSCLTWEHCCRSERIRAEPIWEITGQRMLPMKCFGFVFLLQTICCQPAPQSAQSSWGFVSRERVGRTGRVDSLYGENAAKALIGETRQKAYEVNYRCLEINYGETVDFQLRRQQVLLCPQTVDYLYSRFTPTTVRYPKGSRPELERVVAEVTKSCVSDRDKAIALMRYCRDLYKKREGIDFANISTAEPRSN